MSNFYEKHYGVSCFQPKIEALVRLLSLYLRRYPKPSLRMLEIGCGNGESIAQIAELAERSGIISRKCLALKGWDVSAAGIREAQARGLDAEIKDVTHPDAARNDPGRYDIVIFSEVLEHLVDTGAAMRTIRTILAADGGLLLTTPNLAAWYNRILLPLGFQPFLTELSFEPYRFGNAVFYRLPLIGEKPGINYMLGHLRVFSYRALREFVRYFGFDIVRAMGYASHGDWLSKTIARLWVGGSGSIALLAVPRKNDPAPSPTP